jgi:hypothetical protein
MSAHPAAPKKNLSEQELAEQLAEYQALYAMAKADLIGVFKALRKMPGSTFDFKVTRQGIQTSVPVAGYGEEEHYLGILFNEPRATATSISLPCMTCVICSGENLGETLGIIGRGLYFENQMRAERTISSMMLIIAEEAKRQHISLANIPQAAAEPKASQPGK